MDPLSAIASVIAIYQLGSLVTGLCFHYAQGVKSANRDSEMVMDEIGIFQGSLRKIKIMLEDELERKGNSNRLKALTEIMSPDSPLLNYISGDLEKMRVKLEEETHKQGVKIILRSLKWPFKEEEVKKTLDNLRALAATIDRAQSADTTQMVRNIDTNTSETNTTSKRIEQRLVNAESKRELDVEQKKIDEEKKEKDLTRDKIRTWLDHPDQVKNHFIACKARSQTSSTGQWFLDSDDFTNYKETSGSFLWLHGDPGCGKTILSSAAIEELSAKVELSTKPPKIMAYWYFNANDKSRTNDDNCVRALLTQIMDAMPNEIPGPILDFWTNKKKGAETPKTADLITVLRRLLSEERQKFFILLDALDEASKDAQETIFSLLQSLTLMGGTDIHIFVTSRTYVKNALESKFKSMTTFYDVGIKKALVDADIKIHIEEQLKTDASLKRWPDETKQKILRSLLDKADGMFRWVECQLEAIRACKKEKALDKVLTLLPKDLHEQYTRDLASIPEDDADDALKLLKWLAFPLRKLRLEEAVDMLAVELPESDDEDEYPVFESRNRMIEPDLILEICGSLLRTDIDTNGRDHLGDVATVTTLTTSHATVLEFLSSDPIKVGPLPEILLTKSSVALQMAEVCLGYLHSLFELGIEMTEDSLGTYPFARLCAEYWDDFYRTALEGGDEALSMTRLNKMAIRLLDSKPELLMAVRLCNPNADTSRVDLTFSADELDSPLYYAALHGMTDIVKHYIEEGALIDYKTDRGYGTALVAASALGRDSVVSLLLEKGADPTLGGYYYWGTPLAAAVEQDKISIVKMLLALENVDINSVRYREEEIPVKNDTSEGATERPLEPKEALSYEQQVAQESMVYIAASYNAPVCLTFLLEQKADPNILGGTSCTALQAACQFGRQAMAEQLLSHGAKAGIYGGSMGNALIAACQGFTDTAMVKQLIDSGDIDVNYMGGEGFCALYTAIKQQKRECVELLIDNGANVNIRDCGPTENLLQCACEVGAEAIVKLLLEKGADLSFEGGTYGNAMQAACYASQPGIVKLLIDAGVSPNIKGGSHVYPLLRAVYENEAAVVKVLLENGADPKISGAGEGVWENEYWNDSTPLEHANNLEMVTVLLDAGVSVDHCTSWISSVLARALVAGDEELVKFVLERGADIWQQHTIIGTMLSCAVRSENIALIDLMMEKGLDINAFSEIHEYPTSLHAAASVGQSVTEHLLEKGANAEFIGWKSGSALMAAIALQNEGVINVLVSRDLTCRDGRNLIGQDAFLSAVERDLVDVVEQLLVHGFDKNVRDNRGATGLHYAAVRCNAPMVTALLGHGLDVNSTDKNGATPLHWAVSSGHKSASAVVALLAGKPDKGLKNNQGKTALDLAQEYDKKIDVMLLSADVVSESVGTSYINEVEFMSTWNCDACSNRSKMRYKCQTCKDYDFCDRCHLNKDDIHFPEHSFELILAEEEVPESVVSKDPDIIDDNSAIQGMRAAEHYEKPPSHIGDVWTMYNERSDQNIVCLVGPSSPELLTTSGQHFFEIKILGIGNPAYCAVGIGIAETTATLRGMVGWEEHTQGYHSDNGGFYDSQGFTTNENYGPIYSQGDIVGCGWDFDDASLFFTRNGVRLGSFVGVVNKTYAVITVDFKAEATSDVQVEVNFGSREFAWKDPKFTGI